MTARETWHAIASDLREARENVRAIRAANRSLRKYQPRDRYLAPWWVWVLGIVLGALVLVVGLR